MEKKMYNKPEVEIVEVQGGNVMLTVSEGQGTPPIPHMPAKGGVI
jgi:hypothetical protein